MNNNQKRMADLKSFLEEKGVDVELSSVMQTLADSVIAISARIKTADTCKAGTSNVYGEDQLALDVLADGLIQGECKKNPMIGLIASEELPEEISLGAGEYAIAYDPLDGSSLVDVNLAVGTIFGVHKFAGAQAGAQKTFIGAKGEDQQAALCAVYGPRTTLVLALRDVDGVYEFVLREEGFVLSCSGVEIKEGKMFAPGNLRACKELPKYVELVEYWMREQYTLRYSGGMVPDVCQILLKGKGIFSYPPYSECPSGKLRLLFECAPLSFLVEKACGASSDGRMRILEKPLEELEQRTPIYIGSKDEVARCVKYLA